MYNSSWLESRGERRGKGGGGAGAGAGAGGVWGKEKG